VERIRGLIEHQTNLQTKAAFQKLFDDKKLCFYLECRECCFEIPEKVEVRVMRQLVDNENRPTERSLFDFVPDDLNEYEEKVALFIDKHPEVLWWYRNLVGPENFAVQGYLRELIYPDFVVQRGKHRKPIAKVLVVESKGQHLSGNPDTQYKREIADYFEKVGRKVSWQELGNGFENHQFRFQVVDEGEYTNRDWRDELHRLLEPAEG
jgi:type III restriction enzyme